MSNKSLNEFQPISKTYPLVLASSSPRRKSLLEQIGLPFIIFPNRLDEDKIASESKFSAPLLAEKKALAVLPSVKGRWILGADTIVVLKETVLGKPKDKNDAFDMLKHLGGNEHRVITGFAVVDPAGIVAHTEEIKTIVKMKELTDHEISGYIATGEPFGKAGSYAIQGVGAIMVESISGSYTNVVGLPVCAMINALLHIGALNGFPFQE